MIRQPRFCGRRLYPKTAAPSTRPACSATKLAAGAAAGVGAAPQVVLTREAGKNGKLQRMLEERGVRCLEMPLVETAAGPDRDALPGVLREGGFDWVCLTSPEAAAVFVEGWRAAGRPAVRIAVVGDGTGRVLREQPEAEDLRPQFVPTVANAEHFGPELPALPGGTMCVLYPASNKASSELQGGLVRRGFEVRRLNTYDTLPVADLEPSMLDAARAAAVVAFASPSAVKAWVRLAGEDAAQATAAACIGSTSARAAEKLGIRRVYFPEHPGLEGFADSVMQALAPPRVQ